jgi:hypothetical protein
MNILEKTPKEIEAILRRSMEKVEKQILTLEEGSRVTQETLDLEITI